MRKTIDEIGVTFDTEFEAAAAEDVSLGDDGTVHLSTRVDPKPTGFDEHFKGVPTQYRFSVRITAHQETPALRIHVHTDRELGRLVHPIRRLCQTRPGTGSRFRWKTPPTCRIPATCSSRSRWHEGESVLLGSMPFIAPSELETQIAALERTEGHNWSTRVLGETGKGRKIWALETAPARQAHRDGRHVPGRRTGGGTSWWNWPGGSRSISRIRAGCWTITRSAWCR